MMTDQIYINGQQSQILASTRYVIGRGDECDILLPEDDAAVSRRHAVLQCDESGGWSIVDLASTNGTYLNGQRVTDRGALRDGDRIDIGGNYFVLVAPRAAPVPVMPTAPEPVVETFAAPPTVEIPVQAIPQISPEPVTAVITPAAEVPAAPPTVEIPAQVIPQVNTEPVTAVITPVGETPAASPTVEIPAQAIPQVTSEPVTAVIAPAAEIPNASPTVKIPAQAVPQEPTTTIVSPAGHPGVVTGGETPTVEIPAVSHSPAQAIPESDATAVIPAPAAAETDVQLRRCSRCHRVYPPTEPVCPDCGHGGFKTVQSATAADTVPSAYDFPAGQSTVQLPVRADEQTPFDNPGNATEQLLQPPVPPVRDQFRGIFNPKSYLAEAVDWVPEQQLIIPRILSWAAAPLLLLALFLPWLQFNIFGMQGAFSYASVIAQLRFIKSSDIPDIVKGVQAEPQTLLVMLPLLMLIALIGAAVYAFSAHQSRVTTTRHLLPQATLSLIGGVPGVLAGIWFYFQLQNGNNRMPSFIPLNLNQFVGPGIPLFVIASLVATAAGVWGLALMSRR
jgi:pSer/pThr/pTyr-binding forkhead associated (FHA) protein